MSARTASTNVRSIDRAGRMNSLRKLVSGRAVTGYIGYIRWSMTIAATFLLLGGWDFVEIIRIFCRKRPIRLSAGQRGIVLFYAIQQVRVHPAIPKTLAVHRAEVRITRGFYIDRALRDARTGKYIENVINVSSCPCTELLINCTRLIPCAYNGSDLRVIDAPSTLCSWQRPRTRANCRCSDVAAWRHRVHLWRQEGADHRSGDNLIQVKHFTNRVKLLNISSSAILPSLFL